MSSSRWSLSAESITAAAAVVAALVALTVGVWENTQARRHQRLSVLPYLDLIAEAIRNDTINEATIRLSNTGIGPARIRDITIQVHPESGEMVWKDRWGDAIPEIEKLGVDVNMHIETREGFMLPAAGNHDLIRFSVPPEADDEQALEILERIGVRVAYESLYGDLFDSTFNWRDVPRPEPGESPSG